MRRPPFILTVCLKQSSLLHHASTVFPIHSNRCSSIQKKCHPFFFFFFEVEHENRFYLTPVVFYLVFLFFFSLCFFSVFLLPSYSRPLHLFLTPALTLDCSSRHIAIIVFPQFFSFNRSQSLLSSSTNPPSHSTRYQPSIPSSPNHSVNLVRLLPLRYVISIDFFQLFFSLNITPMLF